MQQPHITVLYASGFPSSALVERRQLQVDAPLVHKPYRKDEITAAVHQALARRHGLAPSAVDA